MWSRRYALASGLALAYSLALLGDQMLYVSGRTAPAVVGAVLVVAIGEGALTPALTVWGGDGAPPHLRGLVMGALATAGDLGAALGPLVGYAMAETTGLRSAYALCGALMLSALLLLGAVRAAAPSLQRA